MSYIIIGIILCAVMITGGLIYIADSIKLFSEVYYEIKLEEMKRNDQRR